MYSLFNRPNISELSHKKGCLNCMLRMKNKHCGEIFIDANSFTFRMSCGFKIGKGVIGLNKIKKHIFYCNGVIYFGKDKKISFLCEKDNYTEIVEFVDNLPNFDTAST